MLQEPEPRREAPPEWAPGGTVPLGHTHSGGRAHPPRNKRSREGHEVCQTRALRSGRERKMRKMPQPQSTVKWLREGHSSREQRERATYRGKRTPPRSCPGSDPCKTRVEWARAPAGRRAEHLHAPPTPVPAGALGLVQAHAGHRGWAPGAVGVPGQHAVLTGAVLPTEGHGGLDHARVGTGIDEPSALWV